MNRPTIISLCFMLALQASAQVRIDGSVEFTVPGSVSGLSPTEAPDALLSLGTERSGAHRFGTPTAGTVWDLEMEALPNGPAAGTALLVRPPSGGEGPVLISVNGLPPLAVLKQGSDTLRAADIPMGVLLYVVHDGTSFQLMNGDQHLRRTCPTDFVSMGGQVCIGTAERAADTFEQAVLTCSDLGARLCSWGEFVAGCQQRLELGLANMTNNLEWTGSTANEDNFVRVAGGTDCQQAGTTASVGPTRAYRCCFSQ
jgi:hypothetical protein